MNRPLCLVCLAFAVSVALYLKIAPDAAFRAEQFDGQQIVLSGQVDRIEFKNEKEIVYLNHVICDSSQRELFSELQKFSKVSCICYISEAEKIRIGSTVLVKGTLRSFSAASNPGEFDYQSYLRLQNLYFSVQDAEICERGSHYDILRDFLYRFRCKCAGLFDQALNEENAGILRAMLLGDKTELAKEDKSLFQKSGISHILAISGLHVSLIGMGLYRLLARLRIPHRFNMGICILFMVLYGMMTGMSQSACRAILMFAISLNAKRVGRTYDMLTALAVAAVCLLLEQPRYVYQAGFQLSFGAVMGMACLEPAMEQIFGKGGKGIGGRARRSVYVSLSIQLVTFPVLLYHYYEYSLYSMWLNFLVLPTVGVVVGSGLMILLCAGMSKWLVRIPAAVCSLLLWGYRNGGGILIRLPGAVWIVGRPKACQLVLYAAGIAGFLLLSLGAGRREAGAGGLRCFSWIYAKKYRTYIIGILGILCSVLVLTVSVKQGMTVTLLDVGQGDGACIEVQSGHAVLIDCGSSDQSGLTEYRLEPFLKSRGIHTLDAVFLSHLDSDHTSGVLGLLSDTRSGIRIRKLILSQALPRDDAWRNMTEAAAKANVELCYMCEGDSYHNGKMSIRCLYPAENTDGSDDRNALSMILLLEYGSFQAVFTGDADEAGELQALSQLAQPEVCDLLKIGHHGSASSSSQRFLEALSPEVAVISCGRNNLYGHPSAQTLERLEAQKITYLTTMEHGAVTIRTDGKRYTVETFR